MTITKVADLIPDNHNANKGTARGLKMVEASIQEDGFGRPVLIDKNGKIIAGNKTIESVAQAFGVDTEVIVVKTDGNKVIVHQREDLDLDDLNGSARRLAYRDNLSSHFSFTLEPEVVLADFEAGFDFEGIGLQVEDLATLLPDVSEFDGNKNAGKDTDPQIDKAEELREKWGVKVGDLWQLGEHRLICGDCTDKAVVDRLMVGEKPQGLFTDPPYAFGLSSTSKMATKSGGWHDIMNNASWFASRYKEWAKNIVNGPLWVFCNWRTLPILMRASFDSGIGIDSVMVWYKDWIGPGGIKGLRPTYELICFSALGDYSIPNRGVEDFINVAWSSHKPNGHRAEKPVELITELINISPVDIVYEPFSGSGTTIIACQNLGRKCRAIEISPAYCAVTLERFFQHTGIEPVLISE